MDEFDSRSHPIQEDMPFQRRTWIAERIGWVIMGALLLAALAGLFFHGPLSHTIARTSDNAIAVEYERFVHKTARTDFRIRADGISREILVRLGPSFVASLDIEVMMPKPVRSSAGNQGLELVFAPSSAADLLIHIGARPKRSGLMRTQIAIEGRDPLNIAQLIYP